MNYETKIIQLTKIVIRLNGKLLVSSISVDRYVYIWWGLSYVLSRRNIDFTCKHIAPLACR